MDKNREFGAVITRLIRKEHLSRDESRGAFIRILNNEVTDMQQGAFLAALAAKGETADEVAGGWEAIYEFDTRKVEISSDNVLVENCGTGMDTFKTFNISTAASLLASSAGIKMARHGARAITSKCGTVDMAEALGVDVECSAALVASSIDTSGIGLFNGMSPEIHPRALGRILSRINFGSTLNIAASLANPAMPRHAVRGVYSRKMIFPVVEVMKAIGFRRAVVLHGGIEGTDRGMDEASVCGTTWCAELCENGDIEAFHFSPRDFQLDVHEPEPLSPDENIDREPGRFVSLLRGKENRARLDAAVLNAGIIFYVAGRAKNIEEGILRASETLRSGAPLEALQKWVGAQNRNPEQGLKILERLVL